MNKYKCIFACQCKRSGQTKLDTHHVIVTEGVPQLTARSRRIPPKWKIEINRHLQEIVETDPPI